MKQRLTGNISVDRITAGPWQYRLAFDGEGIKELSRSLQEHGLLHPVTVRQCERFDGDLPPVYELIAGERRWAAAKLAGWETIKAVVVTGTDRELHEIAILDNLQREDLTPLEEARAFEAFMTETYSDAKQLAARIAKSVGYVSDRLRLLKLSQPAVELAMEYQVPQRTLRNLVALPKDLHESALEYLQDSEAWKGLPTTRQATMYLKALDRFTDAEHWTVPLDVVMSPERRNWIRLIQDTLEHADLVEAGPRLAKLRHSGAWDKNILEVAPTAIDWQTPFVIMAALTGAWEEQDPWQEHAPRLGWECSSCVFTTNEALLQLESRPELKLHCPRTPETARQTCLGFIGAGDPVVLPLNRWDDETHFEKVLTPPEELQEADGTGCYVDDPDLYARLYAAACRVKAAAAESEAESDAVKHVKGLRDYARRLQEDGQLKVAHGLAHLCGGCANNREDQCRFVEEPLKARYGDGTRAPEFAILVRKDGLMVPRCEFFRWTAEAMPELPGRTGFRLPNHAVVISWLDAVCRTAGAHDHHGAISGVLAWLPYKRARTKSADRVKLLAHIRREWDAYGDEGVAWLIGAALVETRARDQWDGTFALPNASTGVQDEWRVIAWADYISGQKPYGWPDDWEAPWCEGSEDE